MFLGLLGGAMAMAVWPRAARAQQPAVPVIGFLGSESPDTWASRLRWFQQGLGDAGYVLGRNVAIEYRWAEGKYDRLIGMAVDLARRDVSMIVTGSISRAALAAKLATTTIPIAFIVGADPVGLGLVASLNRPGGNLTGATSLSVELGPKQLELLHNLVPGATVIAALVNPANPFGVEALSKDLRTAAGIRGMHFHLLRASTDRDFDAVFQTLVQVRARALVIGADAFFATRSERLAALSLQYAIPAASWSPEFAAAGGLISYGASLPDGWRQIGLYAGRILKGEKPADLPVMQPTKFELVINLKTAKALGLTVPDKLLALADAVIE